MKCESANVRHFLGLFFVSILILQFLGCEKKSGENAEAKNGQIAAAVFSDKPLADYQNQLLNIAFETATMIPIDPHIKDRSNSQQAVITACLKLDQPVKAHQFIEQIDNWRRGLCAADLALYCAQNGYPQQALDFLRLAEQIAAKDFSLEWRKKLIEVKITQTRTWLEQTVQDGPAGSQPPNAVQENPVSVDEKTFDERIQTLDAMIALSDFDTTISALQGYTEIFNRYYDNMQRRSLAEDKLKTSWDKLPIPVRLELMMKLVQFALDHADTAKALQLVNESQHFLDDYQWPVEDRISMTSRLAQLRFKAGDSETAHKNADAVRALFDTEGKAIVNIYRAGALRALAEAYRAMGDSNAALSVYKRAVEEGIENPNSRPRAEDLTATCCSMALNAVEPDTELWTRIHQIHKGLGQPW